MVCKSGQLQLIQHFNYMDSKDVLYNLLNCCHQLEHEQGGTGTGNFRND